MVTEALDGDVVCIPQSVSCPGDTIERLPKRSVLYALRAVKKVQGLHRNGARADEVGLAPRVLQFIVRTGLLYEKMNRGAYYKVTADGEAFIAKYTR